MTASPLRRFIALPLAALALVPYPALAGRAPALAQWPAPARKAAPDPALEARIDGIMAGMTLAQKIGQMTQPSILSITPDEVRQYAIGSILNGGGGWPGGNKRARVEDWVALSRAYSQASLASGLKTPIPVIWGTDAVHGHNNIFGATLFPHNIGLGAAHDPALIGRIAALTARQVRATGITWAFAPTVAVVQSPRWGRTYESYSSDPALVRSYSAAFVRGMQGDLGSPTSVVASAKHFIGDGGTYLGKDQGVTSTTRAELIRTHAPGYHAALEAGVQTVMVSYSSWAETGGKGDARKMHGNAELITGVLKQRLGFDGMVVSDWNAIEQVPGCQRDRCVAAVNAGIDLFMVPDNWKGFIANTVEDVEAGRIPMARIDDAVRRIIRVKLRTGLFDGLPADSAEAIGPQALNDAAVRAAAREAVAKSLVLLKNQRGALPLAPGQKLLVVGAAASKVTMQTGGWSLTWQGDEVDESDYPNATTLLTALRAAAGPGATVDYSADGGGVDVSGYDRVIAVLAERPYAEMKGDILHPAPMTHSARYPADLALLRAVAGKGVPVVSVLYSGRPVYANDLINLSDAFVAAWLPGTEAQGIADVLLRGGRDFTGRLSFDWPGDPCPESARAPVLFPRGYGLAYAKARALGTLPESGAATCPAPR